MKRIALDSNLEWTGELTTIDINPECGADIIWDLSEIHIHQLPFENETFDEIGAYDCLEHWGCQGDWEFWFTEMSEYWRILKMGGIMSIIVPTNQAALSDPGHCRFFHPNYFGFLNREFYAENEAKKTSFTDYRWFWKRNFKIIFMEDTGESLAVVLEKTA